MSTFQDTNYPTFNATTLHLRIPSTNFFLQAAVLGLQSLLVERKMTCSLREARDFAIQKAFPNLNLYRKP